MNCLNTGNAVPAPLGSTDFTVVIEHHQQGVVVRVDGEIDALTVDRLTSALSTDTSGRPLVVDLRRVGFLGSVGMAALVVARERTASDGPEVRLVVGDNRTVLRPMTITGLLDRFATFPDVEQALS